MSARQRGTLFVFIAAALYSIGGLCIKFIPWSGLAINGGRTAIAAVVVGSYLILTRHRPQMNRWIFLGAMSVFFAHTLFAIANKMTTATNAIVLQFTAPIFVILFSILCFHKSPSRLDLIACVAVLGGILFFFVDKISAGAMMGNVIALLSGVAYAGVFLLREMPNNDAISSVFWGDVISAVVGLPFLAMETDFSSTALFSLVILGVFQVAIAYILMTEGLKTTPAVTASLVSGIEPVLSPILVALFYGEDVSFMALIGAVIVVVSVVVYNVILARQEVPSGEVKSV
ncbi:MAG: EamA family transporter [Lawsonibacter sp.]|nr:EamA family transporter [Lawsonibacter sp.]